MNSWFIISVKIVNCNVHVLLYASLIVFCSLCIFRHYINKCELTKINILVHIIIVTIATILCIVCNPCKESVYSAINSGVSRLRTPLAPGYYSCKIRVVLTCLASLAWECSRFSLKCFLTFNSFFKFYILVAYIK